MNRLFSILFIFAFGTTSVIAQVPQQNFQQPPADVTDNEIEMFATAFKEIQVIDQQLQQEMMKAVEEEGIDVKRFNDYLEAQQNPALEVEADKQELGQFETAYKEIENMHEKAEQQMQKVIMDNDLSVERYQEIAMSVQANPELLQKLQQHFQE